MRMGIVLDRRKKQRAVRMRRRLLVLMGVLLLGSLAMAPALREKLRNAADAVQTLAASAKAEVTLPEMEIYALQLGVYDSGERAGKEAQRLQAEGVHCMVWQREKMRIVVSAALSRDALDQRAAMGHDAYVISERMESVSVRLSCSAAELENARLLLQTPDRVFKLLFDRETTLEEIVSDTKRIAEKAVGAHPENALYTQLAISLDNWCALMENTMKTETEEGLVRSFAAVTMCTLCRELRFALNQQAASAESTASAQRTPSTAAEVMPPAYPAPSPQG